MHELTQGCRTSRYPKVNQHWLAVAREKARDFYAKTKRPWCRSNMNSTCLKVEIAMETKLFSCPMLSCRLQLRWIAHLLLPLYRESYFGFKVMERVQVIQRVYGVDALTDRVHLSHCIFLELVEV